MLRPQAENSQRRTDIVVEILRGLQRPVLGSQHGGDHLFCGGLSHAAGDLHKGDLESIPISTGQRPEGQTGIVHLDVEFITADILRQFGAEAASSALFQRHVDEIMAVKLLPHPGQKQTARLNLAAVGGNRRHRSHILPGIPPDSANRGGDLLYSHGLHTLNLFSSIDRTTARSPRTVHCMSCRPLPPLWVPGWRKSCLAGS